MSFPDRHWRQYPCVVVGFLYFGCLSTGFLEERFGLGRDTPASRTCSFRRWQTVGEFDLSLPLTLFRFKSLRADSRTYFFKPSRLGFFQSKEPTFPRIRFFGNLFVGELLFCYDAIFREAQFLPYFWSSRLKVWRCSF